MKRECYRIRSCFLVAALLGLSTHESAVAQDAPLKPFRTEDGTPVMRAEPVVRPPRALPVDPVERGAGAEVPVATPLPRATPVPRAGKAKSKREAPEASPASPTATAAKPPPAPEPADPGEIRIAPQTGVIPPEAIQLQIADSYYARKQYDMAAPEYQRYLELYPGGPDLPTVYFRLGESYRQTGSLNAAKDAFELLLSRFQQGEFVGPASYRLADLYYQEKNYAGALPLFRKAAVRVKEPAVANAAKFFAARSAEAVGSKIDARTFYEELIETKENNPFQDASRYSLALLLKDAGRTADALKHLQTVLKQTELPELRAEATVRSGLWMLDLDPPQPAKAAEELKGALEMPGIGRWKEVAQLGLLRVYYDTGKYQQVIDTFEEGGDQFSAEAKPELLLRAANAYRQLGKPNEARKLYEQLTKEFPKSPFAKDAAYERLVPFYNSDDPRLIEELDAWLAENPESPKRDQVMLMKAEALFKKQNYKEAGQVYATVSQSRQLSPAFKAEALFRLGWCAMQTREIERAITAFTDFLTAYPTHRQAAAALVQRAIAYQSQKNFSAAEKDFTEIIRRYPKAKERELALQQKALIRGQQNDNVGMAEAFELLIKDYPESPARAQAEYWIGRAAFEAKDYKKAAPHLGEARQRDREQFFERASLPLILSHYYLEDWEAVAREVDLYAREGKGKVPPEVLRDLSKHYFNRKSYDRAKTYLSSLTKREEAVPNDFLLLGKSWLEQGEFTEAANALQAYLKTVSEPPSRALGLLDLAKAQTGLRDFAAAQKSVDQALTLQPEGKLNGEGVIAAGDILMAQGQFEQAAKTYASVAALLDDEEVTPRALEKAVEAYRKAGKEAEAKKTLNLLQSRYPEYLQQKRTAPQPVQ